MHPQPARASRRHGRGMDRAHVAIKHKVGEALRGNQPVQMGGPVLGSAGVGQVCGAVGPERLVPAVEARAPDLGPGGAQGARQLAEERAMRTLQEQKLANVGHE